MGVRWVATSSWPLCFSLCYRYSSRLIMAWERNFRGSLFLRREEKNTVFREWCEPSQMNWTVSLTPDRVWFFTWHSSSKYCSNISGHMVLIALSIFSTGLFHLQPSAWLAELVWFTIRPGEIWQLPSMVQTEGENRKPGRPVKLHV